MKVYVIVSSSRHGFNVHKAFDTLEKAKDDLKMNFHSEEQGYTLSKDETMSFSKFDNKCEIVELDLN